MSLLEWMQVLKIGCILGIEDWLHLSFELDRTKYSTKDVITGRVTFKKVSMFLKSMLLQIIRREKVIGGETDNAILCRFEIMDGAPIKNEIVPIRFFLSPYELTPTYQNVNNKFSVQYIINLVLFMKLFFIEYQEFPLFSRVVKKKANKKIYGMDIIFI